MPTVLLMERNRANGRPTLPRWSRMCTNGSGKSIPCAIRSGWLINIGKWPVIPVFSIRNGKNRWRWCCKRLRNNSGKTDTDLINSNGRPNDNWIPWIMTVGETLSIRWDWSFLLSGLRMMQRLSVSLFLRICLPLPHWNNWPRFRIRCRVTVLLLHSVWLWPTKCRPLSINMLS